jgi:uncharacterized protein involved in exopolysaccharide biosynthesis
MEIAEIKLSFYFDVLRRHWPAIVGATVLASSLALVYCFVAPKTYLSTAALLPDQGESNITNPLSMITANLGFAAPSKGKNSELYMDVVQSKGFVRTLLQEKIRTSRGAPEDLAAFYHFEKLDSAHRMNALSKKMKNSLKVNKADNGIVKLSLVSPDPVFSAELLASILHNLEIFFKDQEARKMEKSLSFMHEKMDEKEAQFRESSEKLAAFLAQNQYVDPLKTPHLYNRMLGLKRDERIQEEIYLLLYKEYEKARIEKQKESSVMQILDYPEPALDKESPKRRKIMMGAMAGSFLLSYLSLLLLDRLKMKA